MKNEFAVIIEPLITEKNNVLSAAGQFVFRVHPEAGKIEIGQAVEKLFNVKVKSVNVMNYAGKRKRMGRSVKVGRRADWKKAVVTLSEGTINLI